ncbi:Gfo/Idh/MocA family protein [Actinomadura rudentiformis]|uniref:Gfo/Idh/MocA family oxidoreductase n=1 Tax=Actinomadura rudentiformis TaxID=359158 RepID=A0A6H9YQN8_9ACTN|nr:Gfo/Idh/MocA family oxidoreductase [Actinomadura rudentiformis]KAB2341586.1 Gfo/Idh/MocA family oxidoreductase [Actinomadura rudentiformis]
MLIKTSQGAFVIRWGILGAGGIAGSVCHDIALSTGSVVTAVAARDAGRAEAFAARYGAARSYGSYAELLADDDVDVVYVATTHPYHREQALLAIQAGKAVLIEKPVCLNAADAREVFDAARAAGVFAMEAMWMRLNPLIRKAAALVADGAIGEPRWVRAEFGAGLPFDPAHRLYDIANGGGALLDLGIYPATFAYLLLGRPEVVTASGELAATGADDTVAMEWSYGGVPRAHLWCSVSTAAPDQAAILGSTGSITLEGVCRPWSMTLHGPDGRTDFADPLAGQGWGYGPEIVEVERCLREGLLESPLIPHTETIDILEVLDTARAALGVAYPSEQLSV